MGRSNKTTAFENPFIGISAIDPFVKVGVTRIKDIILEYVPGFISPNVLSELLESDLSVCQVVDILPDLIKEMSNYWRKKINSRALRDLTQPHPQCNFLNSITCSFVDITTTTKIINDYLRMSRPHTLDLLKHY